MRILLVEDDRTVARGISFVLHQARMLVDVAETGAEALELAKLYDYDAIIMDVMLPDGEGFDVVRRLRATKNDAPILMLSAQTRAESKIKGLQCGADDYLAKPFDQQELVARLQAIIRRSKGSSDSRLEVGGITMDLSAREVSVDGLPVALTRNEYAILELLVLRRGAVLSKENFLDHLYGGIDEPDAKIIDVFICKLRKKLAVAGADNLIGTVWGRGYIVRDQQMQRSTIPVSPMVKVLAAFEGGGARGIAHIGAWQAACDLDIGFEAVAGTSAGAIVATLAAAGLRPAEVFDPDDPGANIIQSITRRRPTALFPGWYRLALPRLAFRLAGMPLVRLLAAAALISGGMAASERGELGAVALWVLHYAPLGLMAGLAALAALFFPLLWHRGLFPTGAMEAALDGMLAKKLWPSGPPSGRGPRVTFADMADAKCPRLAIIATDIERGEPVVFDAGNCPDMPVADAVAASIAVPGLLRPKSVMLSRRTADGRVAPRSARFLDGGMVSNLPVWVFDDERSLNPDRDTVAFTLPAQATAGEGFFRFCARVLGIAIFGGQNLASRSVRNLSEIPVPSAPLHMLDFDVRPEVAASTFLRARDSARRTLQRQLINQRRQMEEALDTIVMTEPAEMERWLGAARPPAVSASIITRISRACLTVRFQHRSRGGISRGSILTMARSIAGHAQASEAPVIWTAARGLLVVGGRPEPHEPEPRLPPGTVTVFAAPVFRQGDAATLQDPEPVAILTLDVGADLWDYFQEERVLERYRAISRLLGVSLSQLSSWRRYDGFDGEGIST